MNQIYTNMSKRNDFLRNELYKYVNETEISIAVAFFTDSRLIEDILNCKSSVRLVVRLGFPTDANALKKLIGRKNINIRFYTSRRFHPKLYIFGNDIAFLGSSNLTDGGLMRNQEINVSVNSDDSIFEDLLDLFEDYWEEAQVLTEGILSSYHELTKGYKKTINDLENSIKSFIGEYEFPNINNMSITKLTKEVSLGNQLLKRYQLYLDSFEQLKTIYLEYGKRVVSDKELPVRIEIHRFLNWVRNEKAYNDLYLKAPVRLGNELKNFILKEVEQFHNEVSRSDLEYEINSYSILNKSFSSVISIDSLSTDEMIESLMRVTSFYEHARHSKGFKLKNDIINLNGLDKIKKTINYLLFGDEIFQKRIAQCIHNSDLKLVRFGTSSIQELYGWVNKEETPICNERAYKSMRWLGFGKF